MKEFYMIEQNGTLLKYHQIFCDNNNVPIWTFKDVLNSNPKIRDANFDYWMANNAFNK